MKVPELVPRQDIFERQPQDSPSRFAAIYEFGILFGPKAWILVDDLGRGPKARFISETKTHQPM